MENITEKFMLSCKELKTEELVKIDNFDLFSTISAIPVMNPKLDTGMAIKSPAERGKVFKNALQIEELIGLIDLFVTGLMGFLNGQILAHTYLASLHYHNYEDVESDIVKIVISTIGRTLQLSRIICQSSQISFEEDFDGDTVGFPLDPDGFTDERVEEFMELLIDGVERALLSKDVVASFAEVDSSTVSDVKLVGPLLDRLKLVQGIHQTWRLLIQKDYDQATVFIPNVKSLIEKVRDTKNLGANMDSQFDELYLIKSFPQAPPIRKSLSLDEGFGKLMSLFNQLETILSLKLDFNYSNFIFLMNSFSYYNPDSDSFARGILLFATQTQTQQLGKNGIVKAIKISSGVTGECFLDMEFADKQVTSMIDSIYESLESIIQASLKTYSLSRSRQRRHLFHLMLSWEELERSMESCEKKLDCMISKKTDLITTSWVKKLKMAIILDSYTMGFELKLYIPTEYNVMYCYIQFLYSHAAASEVDLDFNGLSLSTSTNTDNFYIELKKYYQIQKLMSLGSFALSSLAQRLSRKREKPYFNFNKYYQNRFQYLGMLSSPPLLQPSQFLQTEQQYSTLSFLELKSTCSDIFKNVKAELIVFKPQEAFMKKCRLKNYALAYMWGLLVEEIMEKTADYIPLKIIQGRLVIISSLIKSLE